MKRRKLLATATLTALLLSVGTLHSAPIGGEPEPASHAQPLAAQTLESAGMADTPQWGAALGFEGLGSFLWGALSAAVCASFAGPGGIACGVTGAA